MQWVGLCGAWIAVMVIGCSDGTDARPEKGSGGRKSVAKSSSVTPSSGGSSAAGESSAGGSSEVVPTDFSGPLGRRCGEGSGCEEGLECFRANDTRFEGYGPASGFCSVTCDEDSDCESYRDEDSQDVPRCVPLVPGLPESAICVPGCRLAEKYGCGGRDDVACFALEESASDGTGRACVPLCNHDEQCPAGTVCDGVTNLCSTWVNSGGLPLGARCDIAAENSCNNGICLEAAEGGVCSSLCRRGSFPQCGGNGEDAICGWVPEGDEKAGPADVGMCARTCERDEDCSGVGHCAKHADREGMTKTGVCKLTE